MPITLNEHLKNEFGFKVYKLALSAVTTCPNRDGTIGFGGCIFCSEEGSGSFASPINLSISEQIETAKAKIKSKTNADKFIAYFQSFTNTYAPIEYLEKVFFEAISHPQVVILSIATRPDCLPDEVLKLLEKLNKIKPVWVELGLQTMHEKTAQYIRRGYSLSCYDNAVEKLKSIGVTIITHMIIGLPSENEEMMVKTADYIGRSGADGIKLQLLHILKGTDLEKDYLAGKFETLSLEKYTEILKKCLAVLPPDMVVHRMTGDGDKKKLIAPLWSANKKKVLNYINKELYK
ncbi:MAG: TIGR01212 family radical SAM protein [Clostridia bacterium]|nr:TIGR01212 family radical SAM protein [Clostridia bacterium]MBO5322225.1 TIGR01212 family radical SAM protein [Clostridia bacterium]